MATAHAAVPQDPEVTAFYALAQLAVAPSDTVSQAHLQRAADLLLGVYRRNPDHPGAMHYLVHASDAPGRGFHWGAEAHHADLPRGERVEFERVGTLEEILFGPSRVADGTMNLIGALKRSMATTGYTDLKEFQRVEVVVSPYQPH